MNRHAVALVLAAALTGLAPAAHAGASLAEDIARLGQGDLAAAVTALGERREPAAIDALIALETGRLRVAGDGRVLIADEDGALRDAASGEVLAATTGL